MSSCAPPFSFSHLICQRKPTKGHHPIPGGIRHIPPPFVLLPLFSLSTQSRTNTAHDLSLERPPQLHLVALTSWRFRVLGLNFGGIASSCSLAVEDPGCGEAAGVAASHRPESDLRHCGISGNAVDAADNKQQTTNSIRLRRCDGNSRVKEGRSLRRVARLEAGGCLSLHFSRPSFWTFGHPGFLSGRYIWPHQQISTRPGGLIHVHVHAPYGLLGTAAALHVLLSALLLHWLAIADF